MFFGRKPLATELREGWEVDIEAILAIIFVLGVPSMALATHVVLRPLIREYAKLKGLKADREEVEARLAQIEDVVHDLDRQVNRLLEAERFRRELEAGRERRSLPEL
jgi:PP-loop superfamily ATP-utilizing enzyme